MKQNVYDVTDYLSNYIEDKAGEEIAAIWYRIAYRENLENELRKLLSFLSGLQYEIVEDPSDNLRDVSIAQSNPEAYIWWIHYEREEELIKIFGEEYKKLERFIDITIKYTCSDIDNIIDECNKLPVFSHP